MWLKGPASLTEKQRDSLDEMLAQPVRTVRAYTLAQQPGSFYELEDHANIEECLRHGSSRRVPASLSASPGYRTSRNFIAMVYPIVGRLNVGPVIPSPPSSREEPRSLY